MNRFVKISYFLYCVDFECLTLVIIAFSIYMRKYRDFYSEPSFFTVLYINKIEIHIKTL